jgi:hypothetical protein
MDGLSDPTALLRTGLGPVGEIVSSFDIKKASHKISVAG